MKAWIESHPTARRMLCLECGYAGEARTLLPGADALEALAWCLFGLPGLAFCAWRHWLRSKCCHMCGGEELMRETRAAAANGIPQAVSSRALVARDRRGSLPWPAGLETPRERLRRGAGPALAMAVLALVALGAPRDPALWMAAFAGLATVSAGSLGTVLLRAARSRRLVAARVAGRRAGRGLGNGA